MQQRVIVFLMALLLFFGGAVRGADPDAGFTPWMVHDDFENWLHGNMSNKPVYIAAAEGRLNKGVPEWRVRIAPAPKGIEWYWWYGMDQKFYDSILDSMSQKRGMRQIWMQSYLDEKGDARYQTIFAKIPQKVPGAP